MPDVIEVNAESAGIEEEQPPKNPAKVLYGGGALVKRWRLTGSNNIVVELGSPRWRVRKDSDRPRMTVGIYIEPDSGAFFARVPEIEDGALYVDKDLMRLRETVRTAAHQHLEWRHPEDARIWERFVRVAYPMPDLHHCETGDGKYMAKIGGHHMQDWNLPATLDLEKIREIVKEGGDQVGPLIATRWERALRHDGKTCDVREWQEDFEVRLARWEKWAARVRGDPPPQPQRHARVESLQPYKHYDRAADTRDLPWSQELWDSLWAFRQRIQALDVAIRDFLLRGDADDLVARMIGAAAIKRIEDLADR